LATAYIKTATAVGTSTDDTLDAIVTTHGAAIVRYCYGILCDYHDAQDAAQTAFLKAHKKLAGLRDAAAAKAWLYRVAYNTCLDMGRNRRLYALLVGRVSAPETVFEDAPDLGLREDLIQALRVLGPKDRALFYSRAVEDLGFNQLAERYGGTPAALRKRYERARKKLAKHLEKTIGGNPHA
jgi:RNA polymerase sigma-70 factor (ECF subfamily)